MKGWSSLPIGQVCTLVNGRAFKPSDWTEDGLPIVRIQNLNDREKPFNRYNGKVSSKVLIDSGEILLSWSGTPGTSFGCFFWDRGPAILNQHIFRVHVDEQKIDRDFFVHAVTSKLDEMIALAHGGVGLRHITKGKLEGIKLPVPSFTEQRRIVARIKECTVRIDEMRSLRAEAAREARALLPSSLATVFEELTKTYEPVAIDEFLVDSRYGTSKKCNSDETAVPVLRIPNVADGRVSFDDLKYCSFDSDELERVRLRPGDLLIVRTNGSPDLVGRCAVFEGGDRAFAFASYLIRLRVDAAKADPRFISFFLSSTKGRDAIARIRRTSAGQFNVNSENLRAIALPNVPVKEQRRLSDLLSEQQAVARAIAEEHAARVNETEHLRSAVLRKAFAGEL